MTSVLAFNPLSATDYLSSSCERSAWYWPATRWARSCRAYLLPVIAVVVVVSLIPLLREVLRERRA